MTVNVLLTGKLIADPACRDTKTGKPMVTGTLAVEVPDPRDATQDPSMLVGVVAFGAQAEALETHRKGDRVAVSGVLQRNHWTAADGAERERLNVLADGVLSARTARDTARSADRASKAARPCNDRAGF